MLLIVKAEEKAQEGIWWKTHVTEVQFSAWNGSPLTILSLHFECFKIILSLLLVRRMANPLTTRPDEPMTVLSERRTISGNSSYVAALSRPHLTARRLYTNMTACNGMLSSTYLAFYTITLERIVWYSDHEWKARRSSSMEELIDSKSLSHKSGARRVTELANQQRGLAKLSRASEGKTLRFVWRSDKLW